MSVDAIAQADAAPSRSGPSLAQRTIASLAWATLSRISGQLVQFAVTAVLARLLVPAQFGLVAMYGVFTGFAVVFVDLGLAAALVQRKDIEERHLSSAFWLNVAAGVGASATISALAPAIAAFYGQPRLLPLTAVASLAFVVGSPGIVHMVLLKRDLNFRRLGMIDVASALVGGVSAVAAAAAGLGVWSLVILGLTSAANRSLLLWLSTGWRPRRQFDRAAVRELWRFSSHLLGFMSINYWSANADNLLVGRFLGAGPLGIYARAYNTMMLPIAQISGAATVVMFPVLSGIQDDRERVKAGYLRSLRLVALVAYPAFVGLLAVADEFIRTAYGARWAHAVPLLRVLCVAGLVQMTVSTGSWIYQSQGRTDWMLRWGVVTCVGTLAAFAAGLRWGALGICVAYTIASLAFLYPGLTIPGRLIGTSFRDVVGAVWRPAVAAGTMGVAIALARVAALGVPAAPRLFLLVAVGIAAYPAALRLVGVNGYRELAALRRGGAPAAA